MAEPDSILQLGIEAAREGNKEQARDLFRLLTRQEPQNAQAWLWLAGVAESREERQAALERVVELEPDNQMAIDRLQAMGVQPPIGAAVHENDSYPIEEPVLPPDDDDDPFADLDSLSEEINKDPGAVRRDPVLVGATDDDYEDRPVAARYDDRPARSRYDDYDDDETEPARQGRSPLLTGLIGAVAIALLLLLCVFVYNTFLGGGNRGVADNTNVQETAAAATSLAGTDGSNNTGAGIDEGTSEITGTAVLGEGADEGAAGDVTPVEGTEGAPAPPVESSTEGAQDDGEQPTPADGSAAGAGTEGQGEQPTPADGSAQPGQPQQPAADVSGANPAIVPANTPLQSEGWLYDFNQPTYATPIIGGLGQFQPDNRYVLVLAFVANESGQAQAVPADFFVLKDAQGRVYEAKPDVSTAYVIPGVNADLNQTQEVPADGVTRSVALIFDVAPDATDLVFFARSKPDQGWLVLQRV